MRLSLANAIEDGKLSDLHVDASESLVIGAPEIGTDILNNFFSEAQELCVATVFERYMFVLR